MNPLLKILPAFLFGILIGEYLPLSPWILPVAAITGLSLSYFLNRLHFPGSTLSFVKSLSIGLLWITAGEWRLREAEPEPLSFFQQYSICQLVSSPVVKNGRLRYEALLYPKQEKNSEPRKIRLNLKDTLPILLPGTWLNIHTTLLPIQSHHNPGGFDYKSYSRRKNILYECHLQKGDYNIHHTPNPFNYQYRIHENRQRILNLLRAYLPTQALGLAQALLIGYREDMDEETRLAYQSTGTMHVVAISGMHLALFYGILLFLLRPLERLHQGRWWQSAIILPFLWAFSLLAGGGPSVLRAAVMCTCMILGRALQKNSTGMNALSASALILLWMDPFLLWDTGFQLSFLAVLGILMGNTVWKTCYTPKNFLGKQLWEMSTVTLSAQLFTLPVTLAQFHQFPWLFLLFNLLLIPLSSLLVVGLALLIPLNIFPDIATVLGEWLGTGIGWMNQFTFWGASLKGTVTQDIPFHPIQSACLLCLLVLLCRYIVIKEKKVVQLLFFFAYTFMLVSIFLLWQSRKQEILIIYKSGQRTILSYIKGRNAWTFSDDPVINSKVIQEGHTYFRVRKNKTIHHLIKSKSALITSSHHRFLWWRSPPVDLSIYNSLKPQMVILSHPGKLTATQWWKQTRIGELVLSGSCPRYIAIKWESEAQTLPLRLHSIPLEGAYILHFSKD